MSGRVVHFEIGCRDTAKAAAFYQDVFGWTTSPYVGAALTAHAGEGGLPGHFNALGHEPHNYLTVYIEVDDMAAALAKLARAGGQKLLGPVPLPDGKSFAWAKDPDGNVIGLMTPPPG